MMSSDWWMEIIPIKQRYCDMTPESRNSQLLDNASADTFSKLRSQQWDFRCLVAGR
jgi:hypothetical protein